MARSLSFTFGDQEVQASIEKVNRKKLYGWTEKHYYDRDGDECYFGSLSSDGATIFGKESFEQGYINDAGQWQERAELNLVDNEGNALQQNQASFKHSITLEEMVSVDEFFEYLTKSVYQLDAPALLAEVQQYQDKIFKFKFNYTASYSPDTAFLVESDNTLFMLVSQATQFEFIESHQVEPALAADEDDEDEDDDIDFSMF